MRTPNDIRYYDTSTSSVERDERIDDEISDMSVYETAETLGGDIPDTIDAIGSAIDTANSHGYGWIADALETTLENISDAMKDKYRDFLRENLRDDYG